MADGNGVKASVPITFGVPVPVSPSLLVSPSNGLSTADQVSIEGAGFSPGSPWLAVECNFTPGEPTGSWWDPNLPVSCDQANAVPNTTNITGPGGPGEPVSLAPYVTDPSGAMSTKLMIQEGNLGQNPETSSYPCPPSRGNLAEGGSCGLVVEDGAGHQATFKLGITGPVPVPTVTVSPSTGLTAGSTVEVTGVNFAPGASAGVSECNEAQGEPTVSYDGIQVPVSCSNPQITSTTATGTVSTSFNVLTGVLGPPTEGVDSAGNLASSDAAAYPCPPTASQQASGVTCGIGVGDLTGNLGVAQISFGSSPSPPPSPTPSACTENGDGAFVCAIYGDLLKRAPEQGGLQYWETQLSGGTSRSQVAYDVVTSSEYGSELVDGYYQRFLGRAPDPAGQAFFEGELAQGATDQSVMETVLGSPEYYADSGAAPDGFVDALYQSLLGRAPEEGGLNYWEAQLAGGIERGTVANEILSSAEYESDLVQALYESLLKRDADPAGLSYWVSELAGGTSYESLTASVAGSPEYYELHAPSPGSTSSP